MRFLFLCHMSEKTEILRNTVQSIGNMEEDAFQAFSEPWTEFSLKRKEIITREGETERYLYLVLDGAQRAYKTYKDKEVTLIFSYAGSFSGVLDSFLLQRPSSFDFETLTASRFLRIHFNDMSALMSRYPSIETWVRIGIAGVLSDTLNRHIEILAYSAEDKFRALLKRSPHILNIVPHKYLASYIGVDPTNFSKLLGAVRI